MTRIARKTLCAPSNYSGSCSGGTRWRCGVEVCAKKRRSPHAWVASSIFYVVYGLLFAPLKSYSLRIAVFSLVKLYLPQNCAAKLLMSTAL